MVADKVDVVSRRAGSDEAWRWSSDGKGTFTVEPADAGGGAGARHPRRPASDGGRQGLYRALQDRAHRQGQFRPRAGADLDRREARRGGGRARRRRRALDQAARRDQARGLHRLLPQRRRPVRRAGADRAFPRRGPPRVHRAGLRAERQAVRPLRSRPQGPDEALRQARVHHRRRGDRCRAICASCAAWSIPPTCRSTCRAR